jgi:transcriptional regulator with XRE-family HTH domain
MPNTNITPEAVQLRSKRMELGLTQHRVAAYLDINQGRVSKWENAKSPIPPYIWAALLRWFKRLHRKARATR